jgi:hypothetical protein
VAGARLLCQETTKSTKIRLKNLSWPVLPLTDFGTMSFTGSTANGSAIGNADGLTEIIMVDNAGRDKDSISALSSGENFGATWLRSN